MGSLNIASCPVCRSTRIKAFIEYKKYPVILFPIEDSKWNSVREAPLESFWCKNCGHIFLNNVDGDFIEALYKDYYYLYPFKNLETMKEPYRKPFETIADIFLTRQEASLLEIGCDEIMQMKSFIDRGYKCTAINPGARPSDKVQFIDGLYSQTCDVSGYYDYIVSRFNLEHMIDLDKFFIALEKNLAPHGVVMVQVPNSAFFLNSGFLSILAHEHTHYFCRNSLSRIIRRHGYDILYISDDNHPSLICVFTKFKPRFSPLKNIKRNKGTLEQIRSFLVKTKGKSVLFYGAGLSLAAILYSDQIERSLLSTIQIIDDNPILNHKVMPNTQLIIKSFDEVNLTRFVAIVLTLNEIYHAKVMEKIKATEIPVNVFAICNNGLSRIL